MSEDRRLLRRLQRGENAAWRQIYLKYKDDLLTIAQSLVHNTETAEDCLQEVFVSLASNGFRIRSNLRGYLLSCVVNRARDHLRRQGAQSNCRVNMPVRRLDLTNPAAILTEDERAKAVTEVLGKLPIEQREVVVLHLQADMTFRRIASMLGLSINTVRSRYRYGMEKLRQLLINKESI
jgi:RNA polymerase sigma factor (sigma-70 family)